MSINILEITLRSDIGGGPEHVFQLLKGLDSLNLFVASPKDPPYAERFSTQLNKEIFEVPTREFSFKVLKQMIKYIKKNKISVVHSHGKGAGVYSRLVKIFCPKVLVVHTFHGWHVGSYSKLGVLLYGYYEFFLSFLTNYFICVSISEKKALPLFYCFFNKSKIKVIPNGVYVADSFKPIQDREIDFVIVSRFDYQKNFDECLEICGYFPSLRIVVLGEINDDAKKYKDIVTKKGLSNITFQGGVSDCRFFFKNAKLILSTSRWEGLPFSIIEAVAEGCVPIISNVTGNNEFLFPNNCFYSLSNIFEAVKKIKSLLNDETTWSNIQESTITEIREKYSLKLMINLNKEVYESSDNSRMVSNNGRI